MKDIIEHTGVVVSASHKMVRVRILQASACSSCSAAGLCKSSEAKEKIIDITTPLAPRFEPGQRVNLQGSTQQGLRATLWAYIVPLAVVVAVLLIARGLTESDGLAALCALFAASLYYIGLYAMRGSLERRFEFTINLTDN